MRPIKYDIQWSLGVLSCASTQSLSFLHGRELLGSEEDDNLISPNGIQVPFVQPLITNYQGPVQQHPSTFAEADERR